MIPEFRVWDKEHKRMLNIETLALSFSPKGVLTSIYTYGPDFSNDPEIIGDDEPDLDSVVLEQYTGMKDVNGNKIFEGDILHCENDYEGTDYTGKVMFFNGGFCVLTGGFRNYVWDDMIPEVIGNIHENPELLEVDE